MNKHLSITLISLYIFTAAHLIASPRPLVTGIMAEIASHSSILLSWTMPSNVNNIDEVLVFCSPVPITSFEQVAYISPRAAIGLRSSWLDKHPLKGEGYYAVVLVTGGERFPVIIPSVNATVTGISAHHKRKARAAPPSEVYEGERGIIPLPGTLLPEKTATDEAQDDAIALSLQGKRMTTDVLFPYIFKEDLIEPQNGEELFLFNILKTTFIKCQYQKASEDIKRLLRTNMARSVTMRSTFYLGECYYFTGEYEKAIVQFLKVRDYSLGDAGGAETDASSAEVDVPSLCGTWIDSSLLLSSLITSPS